MTDLAQDRDDIQALMAPPRTPNVYAALEQLSDEPAPEPAAVATAVMPAPTPEMEAPTSVAPAPEEPAAPVDRADREMQWSALSADDAAASETSWAAMGAEPVGPELLRWRREDDDIVPSGASGGRGKLRLKLRRRSAA